MDDLENLRHKLEITTSERDEYHSALIDQRLANIELAVKDHELRIRPLEDGQIKSNTIYALFAGNGLLSVIALFKLFS